MALRATRAWRAAPNGIGERRLAALRSGAQCAAVHRDEDARETPKCRNKAFDVFGSLNANRWDLPEEMT
jgi:hypothetical protein